MLPRCGTGARIAGYLRPGSDSGRRRGHAGTRAAAITALLVAAGAVASCGSPAPSAAARTGAAATATASLATSTATGADTWAMVPMSAGPAFWQVFARAGTSGTWKLVTPPGVAINGGIVAVAGPADALTVAVRPSDDLTFTPLAATANGGATWSAGGPIDAAVAASPDALAANGSHLAAVLSDGTVETSADAGATWAAVAKPGAIAASPAGQGCDGAVRVNSVSFWMGTADLLAAGTCGTAGATAEFAYSPGGGWQRLRLPVPGQVVRLAGGLTLIAGKAGLTALWRGTGWYAYAPLNGAAQPGGSAPSPATASVIQSAPLPDAGPVVASGTLIGPAGAWVLLPGGRAATVSALGTAPGGSPWVLLPPVPAHTAVLASGPHGAVDALAVAGATLTVWRLPPAATTWSRVQTVNVPIQYGSSS